MPRLISLVLVLMVLGVAQRQASAQATAAAPVAATDAAARADALFSEGKQKLEAQDYAAGCPLLAESFAIDPATGTLLALALCHERAGDVKSAIAEYREAASRSKNEGRADREQASTQRADELEAQLSEQQPPTAPVVEQPEARRTVTRGEPQPRASNGLSTGQWIGIGTAGAGVVALGVSAGLAVHAASLASDSDPGCNGDLCTAQARQTRLDAVDAGNVASLLALSGAAIVCAGAAIFFSSGAERADDYALLPWVAPGAAGATAKARF